MMNHMMKADAALAARAAEGARVILCAVIAVEGGFKNRSCILSEPL